MMVSNFAALLEGLNDLKETEIMLGKYIKIIENSYSLDGPDKKPSNPSHQHECDFPL